MGGKTKRGSGWPLLYIAGAAYLIAVGCSRQVPPTSSARCAPEVEAEAPVEFGSVQEARDHFEQRADESHRAMLRYENALRSLREDRRWDEPDQRIWLSIATTETLIAIEHNRHIEEQAQQQLRLLAQR